MQVSTGYSHGLGVGGATVAGEAQASGASGDCRGGVNTLTGERNCHARGIAAGESHGAGVSLRHISSGSECYGNCCTRASVAVFRD